MQITIAVFVRSILQIKAGDITKESPGSACDLANFVPALFRLE